MNISTVVGVQIKLIFLLSENQRFCSAKVKPRNVTLIFVF